MKIESLEQLKSNWAELIKSDTSIAAVEDFIAPMEQAAKEYVEKVKAAETLAEQFKAGQAAAEQRANDLAASLADLQKQLDEVRQTAAAAEAQQKFTDRMGSFDEKFNLDDEDRKLLAEDIRALTSDEAFEAYAKKMEKFLAPKKKGEKPVENKDKDKKEGKEKECEASVAAAIASVEEIPGQPVPVNSAVPPVQKSLLEQMHDAFAGALHINSKSVAELQKAAAEKAAKE